jgi:hypothetical protein
MALFPAAFTSSKIAKQPTAKVQPKLLRNAKSTCAIFGQQAVLPGLKNLLLRNKDLKGQLADLDASMSLVVRSLQRHRQKDEGSKFLQFIENSDHQLLQSSSFHLLANLLENEELAAEISVQSEFSGHENCLQQEIDLLHERQASERLSDEEMMLDSTTEQPTWLFQMFVEGQHSVPVEENENFL